MPLEKHVSTLWKCVGGVSGRPTRKNAERSTSSSASRRWKAPRFLGWRCPSRGLVGTKTSVGPTRNRGSPPTVSIAPTTAGALWTPRRGTFVSMREKAHAPIERLRAFSIDRGRVLHSVQRPVLVNRHSTKTAQAVFGGALSGVSRSGKPAQAGGTGPGVLERRTQRGSPRDHRFRKGECVARKKRKEVAASVPARNRELGLMARTSKKCSCRSRQATVGPK